MKKNYIILSILALTVVSMTVSSCKSDDDVEYDDHCYISSYSLGSIKRIMYTTATTGEDSTYYYTFAGSIFPMTINQKTLTIENLDSLPLRSNVSAVLTTVGYTGVLAWREKTDDNSATWETYSSSDSMDLTKPLEYAVMSTDGTSSRIYDLKVNVHQQRGDTMVWNQLDPTISTTAMTGLGERRMVVLNDQLYTLALNGEGSLLALSHPLSVATADDQWTTSSTTGADGINLTSLQQSDGTLYASTTSGAVISSTDGTTWNTLAAATDGITLTGVSSAYLYAMADGTIKRMAVTGGTWEDETVDDDTSLLPTTGIMSQTYQQTNGYHRIVMAGTREESADTSAVVWSKMWVNDSQESEASWVHYTRSAADKHQCPILESTNMLPYDDGLIVFGGKSSTGHTSAMGMLFYSADNGLVWKLTEHGDMNIEPALTEAAQSAQYISGAVDKNNFLWILTDGLVWRGRINRLGFLRQDI